MDLGSKNGFWGGPETAEVHSHPALWGEVRVPTRSGGSKSRVWRSKMTIFEGPERGLERSGGSNLRVLAQCLSYGGFCNG